VTYLSGKRWSQDRMALQEDNERIGGFSLLQITHKYNGKIVIFWK